MNNPIVNNIHALSWNSSHDCTFEATLTNNVVTDLHFCEPPAKAGEEQVCVRSVNENFLRQLAANLTELLAYIDRGREATGQFAVSGGAVENVVPKA